MNVFFIINSGARQIFNIFYGGCVRGKVWILSISVSEEEVEEDQTEDKDARVARAPA